MSDYWEAWLYGGDTYDRRTREQLEDVQAEQARARNRLAEQMRQQQGDLQAQIDRLTDAFVALVEHEDIRGELTEHTEAAACRRYAREVVANVVVTGGSGLGALTAPATVQDYWLSWAVRGLVATASGGDGAADLARARQLDPRRSTLLLVLIDTIRREPRFSTGLLESALPGSARITRVERQIWLAAADGRLGEAAVPALEERLRRALGTPDPAAVEARVQDLVPQRRDVPAATRAGATLAALLHLVDPELTGAGRYVVEADDPHDPDDAEDGAGRSAEDPLSDLLRALVDEGAPGESEILTRMTDVRTRMGFVAGPDAAARWDAPAGDVQALLLDDLTDRSAPPARRRLAARLLAPALPPVVAGLRSQALVLPAPRMVHQSGEDVAINADGTVDPGWRQRMEQRMAAEDAAPAALRPGAYAVLGAAVLSLGLVVVSPTWLVLTLALVAGGIGLLAYERSLRTETARSVDRRLRRADGEIERAALAQSEAHAQTQGVATQAEESAARLEVVVADLVGGASTLPS